MERIVLTISYWVLQALEASSEHQNDITIPETTIVHEQLWVEKYAPSSFTELLSDEQTNREVHTSYLHT